MAYVSKELKAKIKTALNEVVPKTWKWSLAIDHHSCIVMTISKGPKELAIIPAGVEFNGTQRPERAVDSRQINDKHVDSSMIAGETRDIVVKIVKALNTDNYDKSDSQSDYYNVGHYVTLRVGRWDKAFVAI